MGFINHIARIVLPILSVFILLSYIAAGFYNTSYVHINSRGVISTTIIQQPEIYRSETIYVSVNLDYWYYNGVYGNWTKVAEILSQYNVTGITGGFLYNYKAFFPTSYFGSQTGRDELALSIQAARMFGLKQQVAFAVLYKSPKNEWKVKAWAPNGTLYTYNWLDPTNPEAREYILNLTRELVTKYDFDVLILDYLRYDGWEMPYSDTAKAMLEEYLNETITNWPGDFAPYGSRWGEFLQWRTIPINTLVKEIYHLVKSIKPHIEVAAYTRQWWAHPYYIIAEIGQDVTAWIKDGCLDRLTPMTYVKLPSSVNTSISNYLAYALAGPEGAIPIAPILAIRLFDENKTLLTVSEFAQLVAKARELGCDGFLINRYGGPGDNPYRPDVMPDIRPYLDALNFTEPAWTLGNITVQALGQNAVKISWQTSKPTISKVEYNTSKLFDAVRVWHNPDWYPGMYYWDMNYFPGITVENTTLTTNHEIILNNLQPNTPYYFRIQSVGENGIAVTSKLYTFKL
ncbi:MAG: family 10 glycosylhydrolase [Nitrososphaeria archaeon]